MKYIKYMVVLVLVFLGIALPGEIYQNYVSGFMCEPNTSFEVPDGTDGKVMLQDILNVAREHKIQMYFVESKVKNRYLEEINIYCDLEVKAYIQHKYGIEEGFVKSLLSGENRVSFCDWKELSEQSMRNTPSGWYMLVTLEQAREFKLELEEKYDGGLAQIMYSDDTTGYRIALAVIWFIIIGIIMLINYYECVSLKKEIMIRITMGDSLYTRAGRRIIGDVTFYIIVFVALYCCITQYEGGAFLKEVTIIAGVFLVVLNALVSCSVLIINHKKAFANVGVEGDVLKVSYIIKAITTVVLVLFVANNIIEAIPYFEALSQKELYEKYIGYKFLDFRATADVEEPDMWFSQSIEFYEKNIVSHDIVAYEWIVDDPDYNVMMANANFKWYLEDVIDEFTYVDAGHTNYMFIHASYKDTATEKEIKRWNMYLSDSVKSADVKIVYYEDNVNIPVQNSYTSNPYTYIKNPVICYSNQTEFSTSLENKDGVMSQITLPRYFVDISDEEVQELKANIRDLGVDVMVSDVYEIYSYELMVVERVFICNLVVSLMLIVIELLLIFTIVRMEYAANRKEIVIKKILGYSLIARFKKLYKTTLVTGILGVAVILFIILKWNLSYELMIMGIAIALLVVECIVIISVCLVSDRTNIQRILKNGI